ncbi:MAG: hypothetical protein EBZ53_07400 [Verrucomicrobia bacterium]|nr:hypothetical protein [Verrucomicrobiota bacterium]
MLGVPLLSASFGLNEAGTWQSVSLALLILAASGYLLVLVLMDLFSTDAYKRDALLATDYKQRWKPLVLSAEERESARECAREAAQEYRTDAVLDWIRQGKYGRLAVSADYDDFEEMGLGRFIEEKALEVEP